MMFYTDKDYEFNFFRKEDNMCKSNVQNVRLDNIKRESFERINRIHEKINNMKNKTTK
jgi:hypothetical protein